MTEVTHLMNQGKHVVQSQTGVEGRFNSPEEAAAYAGELVSKLGIQAWVESPQTSPCLCGEEDSQDCSTHG
jgi:hypothetical protein